MLFKLIELLLKNIFKVVYVEDWKLFQAMNPWNNLQRCTNLPAQQNMYDMSG